MIAVVPYDPSWPELFRSLEQELDGAISVPHTVHHIGSTAVEGLAAKPIIDALVCVPIDHLKDQTLQGALGDLGFSALKIHSFEGRSVYARRDHGIRANVHVVAREGNLWRQLMSFRDYLRVKPEVAHRYGQLKRQLAIQNSTDARSYNNGKAPFIASVSSDAARLFREQNPRARPVHINMDEAGYTTNGENGNGNGNGITLGQLMSAAPFLTGNGQGPLGSQDNPYVDPGVDMQYGSDNSWTATPGAAYGQVGLYDGPDGWTIAPL